MAGSPRSSRHHVSLTSWPPFFGPITIWRGLCIDEDTNLYPMARPALRFSGPKAEPQNRVLYIQNNLQFIISILDFHKKIKFVESNKNSQAFTNFPSITSSKLKHNKNKQTSIHRFLKNFPSKHYRFISFAIVKNISKPHTSNLEKQDSSSIIKN